MNWLVKENKKAIKQLKKVPRYIQAEYLLWRNIVTNDGLEKIKEKKGYNFEKLTGTRQGEYSCRLSRAYRMLFAIDGKNITVTVLEVNKHEY